MLVTHTVIALAPRCNRSHSRLRLDHNRIRSLAGLQALTRLRVLTLNYNAIDAFGEVSEMQSLSTLNLAHNNISKITSLRPLAVRPHYRCPALMSIHSHCLLFSYLMCL